MEASYEVKAGTEGIWGGSSLSRLGALGLVLAVVARSARLTFQRLLLRRH